jgi:DNA polymerase-3 subunit epsilon
MPRPAGAGPLPLDAALYEVTFVVIDVETTGGSPEDAELIEVGGAAFRGGERLGAFHSLVRADGAVPPFVTELTGITDDMVRLAPPPAAVLPRLLELVADSVVVGHNVSFDLGFLDAALARLGRPALANPRVDTLAMARRLVRDQAPDCALGTLARALRLEHRPSHRALDDALATADLLHRLIEAATGYGVLHLGDLLALGERVAPMAAPGDRALLSA